jgi:hypothetical protein
MSASLLEALAAFEPTVPITQHYWAELDNNIVVDLNTGTTPPPNSVPISAEQYATLRVAYTVYKDGKVYERKPTTYTANRLKKLDSATDSVYTVYKDFPWLVCTSTTPADYYTITDE